MGMLRAMSKLSSYARKGTALWVALSTVVVFACAASLLLYWPDELTAQAQVVASLVGAALGSGIAVGSSVLLSRRAEANRRRQLRELFLDVSSEWRTRLKNVGASLTRFAAGEPWPEGAEARVWDSGLLVCDSSFLRMVKELDGLRPLLVNEGISALAVDRRLRAFADDMTRFPSLIGLRTTLVSPARHEQPAPRRSPTEEETVVKATYVRELLERVDRAIRLDS